jgi:ADP-heptose:LPS heptosyltransferase
LPTPAQVRRLLVIRTDELGDLVMFTPLLRELRRLYPHAHITVVVNPALRHLLEACPYVNQVVPSFYALVPRWRRPFLLPWRAFWTAYRCRGNTAFDLALLPRWEPDNVYATFLAFFSGATWRLGYSESVSLRRQRLNCGFDRLLTTHLHAGPLLHSVQHNLAFIPLLGGQVGEDRLELWTNPQDDEHALRLLREYQVEADALLVGLGPSKGHSVLKQWPPARFAELGRQLAERHGARILLVGSPDEQALGKEIADQLPAGTINAVGRTSLRQLVALLRHCQVFVSNDTGLMHVAAATGTPTLGLYGPTCPHRFRPWGPAHQVLWLGLDCCPCHGPQHYNQCQRCIYDQPRCMLDITVDTVAATVAKMLHSQLTAV